MSNVEKTRRFLQQTKNLVFLAAGIFFLCLYLAFASYNPFPYSIHTDWISNLGNPLLNWRGHEFFKWGCIISGFILFLVFLRAKLPLLIGTGIVMSGALIMVGIHPSNMPVEHTFYANWFFIACVLCVIIICLTIMSKPILYFGLFSLFTLFCFFILFRNPLSEWICFLTNFCFIIFIAYMNFDLFEKEQKLEV